MRTRIAHTVVVVLGLLIMVYPLTVGAAAEVTCRGAVMRPGEACTKADGSQQQTYEQRAAARTGARPVIIGLGLLVTAFGASLLVLDLRRGSADPAGAGGPG